MVGTAYQVCVKGIASSTANYLHVYSYVGSNIEVRDSYFYYTKNLATESYGIGSASAVSNALFENNIVQATSRTLWEEVKFDNKNVTSVDWKTYPILDVTEAPEEVDIVVIDHPDIAPSGAGEASSRPVAAAIANAVFDATGVRIRRAPLSPANVKQALS